jgi:hypothetical protein
LSQKLFSNTLGSNTSLGLKNSTENWKFWQEKLQRILIIEYREGIE